jgi:hypothetical protein
VLGDDEMNAETVALLGGLLFLLLALVGGGFTIKEISMPSVPALGRAACLVVGVGLILLSVLRFGPNDTTTADPPQTGPPPAQTGPPAASAESTVLYEDLSPHGSRANIQVSGLRATGERNPAAEGDQILIEFSLTNVGSGPVTLEETFIGARNPNGDNVDFASANEGEVLAPGAAITVRRSTEVNASGTWIFWPCYTVGGNDCPDQWQAFEIVVK